MTETKFRETDSERNTPCMCMLSRGTCSCDSVCLGLPAGFIKGGDGAAVPAAGNKRARVEYASVSLAICIYLSQSFCMYMACVLRLS
jgi:hypothetical protein